VYNIVLLSNTNVEPITNKMSIDNNVYKLSGYGNVFEELLKSITGLIIFTAVMIQILIILYQMWIFEIE